MAFADDYLQQLERFARCGPLPRVKALHLPPRDPESGKWGEFCALELADGSLGLSYVMLDDTLTRLIEEDAGRQLAGADALQLASGYQNGSGLARTLGFAAANALTRARGAGARVFLPGPCVPRPARGPRKNREWYRTFGGDGDCFTGDSSRWGTALPQWFSFRWIR